MTKTAGDGGGIVTGSVNNDRTFPTVRNLFSAYLNQDFDVIFGTADDAIRAFVLHNDVSKVSLAVNEMQEIIATNLDSQELSKLIFEDLGSYYYYPSEWASGKLWLGHVLKILEDSSGG